MTRNPGPGSPSPSQNGPGQRPGGHRGLWEVNATVTRTHRALLGCLGRFLRTKCHAVCTGAPGKMPVQYSVAILKKKMVQ